MNKILIFVVLVFLFSSCATQKKCNKKFPAQVVWQKDSIIEKEIIILRDTTIYVNLPKDTVKLTETIYVKNGVVNMAEKIVEVGIVSASAKIVNNNLRVLGWLNDSGVFVTLKDAITERDKYKEIISKTVKQKTIEVNKLTQWQIFQMWLGRILAVIILGFLVIKAIKLYLR